jgi:hypothetical protein
LTGAEPATLVFSSVWQLFWPKFSFFLSSHPKTSLLFFQVMACVEEDDCRVLCNDNDNDRVKREVAASHDLGGDLDDSPTAERHNNKGRTEDWREKLEIRVVSLAEASGGGDGTGGGVTSVAECRLYLVVTLATALVFCVLSGAIVVFACLREGENKKELRHLHLCEIAHAHLKYYLNICRLCLSQGGENKRLRYLHTCEIGHGHHYII